MTTVTIDATEITSFEQFHVVFARVMGFPGFYGANMNAWIDCMTSLDEPADGLSTVHCEKGEFVTVVIDSAGSMPADVLQALNECAAFVNWRRMEGGDSPVLALSYWRR